MCIHACGWVCVYTQPQNDIYTWAELIDCTFCFLFSCVKGLILWAMTFVSSILVGWCWQSHVADRDSCNVNTDWPKQQLHIVLHSRGISLFTLSLATTPLDWTYFAKPPLTLAGAKFVTSCYQNMFTTSSTLRSLLLLAFVWAQLPINEYYETYLLF